MGLIPQSQIFINLINPHEYGYILLSVSCSTLFWAFLFLILNNVTSLYRFCLVIFMKVLQKEYEIKKSWFHFFRRTPHIRRTTKISLAGIDHNDLIENQDIINLSIDDGDHHSAIFHQKFVNELNLKVLTSLIFPHIFDNLANPCNRRS